MPRTVYDDLADRIRGLVEDRVAATAPKVLRFKVLTADPLVIEQIDGELVLEEGDPDVEIDRRLIATPEDRPDVGDLVRVHHDGEDWIVAGVID